MSNATSMKVGGRPPQQDSRCGGVEMQVAAVTHPGTTTSGSGGWDWKKNPAENINTALTTRMESVFHLLAVFP